MAQPIPVYEFNAEIDGHLCITNKPVADYPLYRKVGGLWVEVRKDGYLTTIGRQNTCIKIEYAGEYAVGDKSGRVCPTAPDFVETTFEFTPNPYASVQECGEQSE